MTQVQRDTGAADSDHVPDRGHVVQFYDDAEQLVTTVVSYLSRSVLDGDNVIVIATPAHRASFEKALRSAGVDVASAREEGQLVVLDAAETLAQLMVDGRPDASAFESVVGELIRAKTGGGSQVRAYGEMVSVLWEAGSVAAAIELEKLWNDLGDSLSFSLFCAYPTRAVSSPEDRDSLAEVCALHSGVIAGLSGPVRAAASLRFVGTPDAARLARRFVADALTAWDLAALVDKAMLVTAELAANAVLHAGGDFTVGISRHDQGIRLEVLDSASAPPLVRQPGPSEPTGRGLRLVQALASSWGSSPVEGGKIVWVELTAPSALDAHSASR